MSRPRADAPDSVARPRVAAPESTGHNGISACAVEDLIAELGRRFPYSRYEQVVRPDDIVWSRAEFWNPFLKSIR